MRDSPNSRTRMSTLRRAPISPPQRALVMLVACAPPSDRGCFLALGGGLRIRSFAHSPMRFVDGFESFRHPVIMVGDPFQGGSIVENVLVGGNDAPLIGVIAEPQRLIQPRAHIPQRRPRLRSSLAAQARH